jgi:hypothetical protein
VAESYAPSPIGTIRPDLETFTMSKAVHAPRRPTARSTKSGKVRTAAWIGALSAATLVVLIVSSTRISKAELGNEASAIGALRAVNSAQATFASSCGGRGYVTDLADLVKKPRGSSQGFISPDLSHNGIVKSGYVITVAHDAVPDGTQLSSAACVELSSPLVSSYFASAVPLNQARPGRASLRPMRAARSTNRPLDRFRIRSLPPRHPFSS